MPAPHRHRTPADPDLLFCANCQVSIAAIELERGTAKRTPRGRIFCTLCTRAKPTERETRRRALEQEFADDAPIVEPAPIAAPPRPTRAVPETPRLTLEERIGQLERTILRMQEQLHRLEQRSEDARGA